MHDGAVTILVMGLTAAKLFAQGVPPAIDPATGSLVGLFGNLGIMGVLVWHMYYHTTKTYPNMLAAFSREQEEARKAHSEEQEEARMAHAREQEEARKLFLAEQEKTRQHHAAEMTELRGMLIQTLTSMRVAVHDVRDTANAVALKAEAHRRADKSKE